MDQVCLDIPPSGWDGEVAFWETLTGWARVPAGEFDRLLRPPGVPLAFLLQRLADEQPGVTAHLDVACDDREAETARQQGAGCGRGPSYDGVDGHARPGRPGVLHHRPRSRGGVTVRVRLAIDDDWPQIWPIVASTVRAGETYTYDPGLSSDEARELWLPGSPRCTVVAETDGVVLGAATMGPNRPGRGAHLGTASFMVSPRPGDTVSAGRSASGSWSGTASTASGGSVFNAVVETNTAAVALWRSLGFVVVGTVPGAFDHPRHGFVGLHVMYLGLT